MFREAVETIEARRRPMDLEQYLRGAHARQVIDHAVRLHTCDDGTVHIYIHPANTDGDTLDFFVDANRLIPLRNGVPA